MRCEHLLAALVAIVALVGCQTGATCIRHSDCASGLVCGSDNLCAAPPDAAWPDGGLDARPDAGPDAGLDDPLRRDAPPSADPALDASIGDGGHAGDAPPALDGAIAAPEAAP